MLLSFSLFFTGETSQKRHRHRRFNGRKVNPIDDFDWCRDKVWIFLVLYYSLKAFGNLWGVSNVTKSRKGHHRLKWTRMVHKPQPPATIFGLNFNSISIEMLKREHSSWSCKWKKHVSLVFFRPIFIPKELFIYFEKKKKGSSPLRMKLAI